MNILSQLIYDDAAKIDGQVNFSELHKKTVLVTGATGLIGNYIIASLKRLVDTGKIKVNVIAVVQSQPEPYFNDFLPKGAKILKGDLSDDNFLKKVPKADYIIHAAGYAQPGLFLENQVKTLKLNTVATFSLLEKLKPKGKFLFVSSSEVYTGSDKIPFKEDTIGCTNTTHSRACYIEGKRCGEAISYAYRLKGFDVKVARTSLVYGPGTKMGDRRVLHSFIEKALAGRIEMLDAGTAGRTYCYITDIVEIFWHILLFGTDFIYNAGGESKITIAELAQKIGKVMNVPVKFPPINQSLPGAPLDVSLDLSKVKTEFKKNKFISFDEGLAKTIAWHKRLWSNKLTRDK